MASGPALSLNNGVLYSVSGSNPCLLILNWIIAVDFRQEKMVENYRIDTNDMQRANRPVHTKALFGI